MDAKVNRTAAQLETDSTVDTLEGPDSLSARLGDLGHRVPPPLIADVWLFPPLPELATSAEFLLFTRILEDGTRALYSACMVPENGRPSHQVVVEHGRAPADRVPKLVNRLQRRLGQVSPARHVPIDGDQGRWQALLEQSREASGANGASHSD